MISISKLIARRVVVVILFVLVPSEAIRIITAMKDWARPRLAYSLIDLGSNEMVPMNLADQPSVINDSGDIALSLSDATLLMPRAPGRACLIRNGKQITLPIPSGCDRSWVSGMNGHSQIVGFAQNLKTTQGQTLIWTGVKLTKVMNWTPFNLVINDSGDLAGTGVIDDHYKGFSLIAGRKVMVPDAIFTRSNIYGLNNHGVAVGFGSGERSNDMPFLFDQGKVIKLDTGSFKGIAGAYAINDAGDVVGGCGNPTLWANNKRVDLGSFADDGFALGINDNRQIVGFCRWDRNIVQLYMNADRQHAFLWQKGTMYDLNDCVNEKDWVLINASSINNKGEIVGTGEYHGESHVFLLKPR